MTTVNHVKHILRNGGQAIGLWSIINSPMVVEIAASAGVDFQILDLEHGVFDNSGINECIRSLAGHACSPLVRVPVVDPPLIQKCLDMGCHGVVVPQVRTAEDAARTVASCRLAPKGIRGFNPFTRAGDYAGKSNTDYFSDNFPLVVVIIENPDAYKNIRDIVKVEGVDVLYLGVYDMSCALGIKGQMNHPDLIAFTKECSELAKASGKSVGVMVENRADLTNRAASGVGFGVLKPDAWQYQQAIQSKL